MHVQSIERRNPSILVAAAAAPSTLLARAAPAARGEIQVSHLGGYVLLVSLVYPLVKSVIGLVLLYWAVRLGIRHGLRDVDQNRQAG
jgi:hypothetical protein